VAVLVVVVVAEVVDVVDSGYCGDEINRNVFCGVYSTHGIKKWKLYERDNLHDLDIGGRKIVKACVKETNMKTRTGFISLKLGSSGRLLCVW
jgi:hypothetical protein